MIARVSGEVIARANDHVVVDDEAAAALQALGYSASEALAALRGVPPVGAASTEERVTSALRAAGRTAVAGR